ncbi:protein EARLY FLOWERING 3-like [Sesbania bispinosa]|nr:protein EARLY FLOWERING 3-like [Sesbania bispinosa]
MKRGKEEEKVVVPMFPRLHVNNKEKGGPRAPPRNKMALYEQFSVPFQRFNPRLVPLNPNPNPNPSSNSAPPPPSSTQGNDPERSHNFPVCLPSQTLTHPAESYISRQSDVANMDTSLAQLEQRKRVDEDDFHVYDHSRKTQESFNGKKLTPMGSRNFGCSVAVQNDGDKDQAQFGSPLVNMRKDVTSESEGHPQVSPRRQQPVMSFKNMSTGEIIDSLVRQAKVIRDQEVQDCSVSNISRLHQGDACLQQQRTAGSQSDDIEHGNGHLDSTRANQTSPLETTNDTEYHDTSTGSPIRKENLDDSDDVSKISTVENLSGLKLSPDGIVRILGQKQFWKARREIANQQRVFAVQVFELHRLIKVQQLIAGSPDFLLEDGAFIGKIPLKRSTPKNLSLEVVVEPQPQNLKRKDDSEKVNHKMECSAENAVGKTSFLSQNNGNHLSNYNPFSGNPHQAPGHQLLIPFMSPTEGLVYKPYPGPGFTGAMYGGCGPYGQGPLDGTFMNPSYVVPAFHQMIGVSPFIPPGSHAYFPPHGVPATNQSASGSAVEQVNQFSAQGSHGQNGHSSVEGANFNTHKQSSCNLPVKRNGAILHATKFQASKESELQGITVSSPSEMAQGIRTRKIAEARDAHSPSHMVPLVSEGVLKSLETRQQTQVIKVVPHNRRSATESAARIFKSIQEERKQYDFV